MIRHIAAAKGARPGEFEFKTPERAPHPDTLKIVLTGKHLPETMLRLAQWSAERHDSRATYYSTRSRNRKAG